ncbi:MAG: hypothetical protein HQL84_06205 [Magnetococcales bacterium]|nr:hypothetical protein [Magnetococcales bacterium]MBF0149624.1 hypothetical protein [Magnetococcales bacterium]MBF0172470.1 hypothetical protein [Magnetococcales bacterium]MBF0347555.1 hypothetical protein [Magnetococcales bacterium]MBF0632104.1 hypothetical protein [Magnetococcales bacterium]
MKLSDKSRIAIVGGGPAGSMAGFFLMELSQRIGMKIHVDLYEPKDFSRFGPAGCNMCAGVISETLVQTLAAEGIDLPSRVVQRGIESYVLHTSGCQPVTVATPVDDMRIATVYRGSGPQEPTGRLDWRSFDGYLQELARQHGVRIIQQRVTDLKWNDGRPEVICRDQEGEVYDLLIGAVGVNSNLLKKFEGMGFSFQSPTTSKGFLSEIHLGKEQVQNYLGNSMHIFLLDIPGLKFAALIPKVEYVTICLLGDRIDRPLVEKFMRSAEVRRCFPADMAWCPDDLGCEVGQACHCGPKLNLGPALHPFADRVVLVGDSVVSRLYKDGIGAAYITAKACAVTSLFLGISANDFHRHYGPVIRRIARDNKIGKIVFFITVFYQKFQFLRRGMVLMVRQERGETSNHRLMGRVLWDTFTGSATYREILFRSLHPSFILKLIVSTLTAALWPGAMRWHANQEEKKIGGLESGVKNPVKE